MLSSVLRSPRAAKVNVEIMRAFVRMRGFLASQGELTKRLAHLEKKSAVHSEAVREIFRVIKGLIPPARGTRPKREIGFHTGMAPQPAAKPTRKRRVKPANP